MKMSLARIYQKKTAKTYIFCDGEIDKFCLMLLKDI